MTPPVPVPLHERPTWHGLVVPIITLRHRNGTPIFGEVDSAQVEALPAESTLPVVRQTTDRHCGADGQAAGFHGRLRRRACTASLVRRLLTSGMPNAVRSA